MVIGVIARLDTVFTQDEEFYNLRHMQQTQIIEKKWFELVFFFSCFVFMFTSLNIVFDCLCDFVFFF